MDKKKILIWGIPIVLGIVLVSALIYVGLHTQFVKNLHIWKSGAGEGTVSVSASGDIGTSTISCENGVCSSGDITLSNGDTAQHVCTISTVGDERVAVTYSSEVIDGTITLAGGESKTFHINYSSDSILDTPMTTNIDC